MTVSPEMIEKAADRSVLDLALQLGAAAKMRRAPEAGVPCPGCGGTDRFSINPGKNIFLCRASGAAGNAIDLIRHVHDLTFTDAVEQLTGMQAMPAPKRTEAEDDRYREWARERAYTIWREGVPIGDLAAAYFARRGIPMPTWRISALREHRRLETSPMTIERYRLANPEHRLPMPDRGGRLFTAAAEGEAVDTSDRFWATLIVDGDIVPVMPPADPPVPPPSDPPPALPRARKRKGN